MMRMDVYEVARRLGAEFGVPAAHVAAVIEVESAGIYEPCQIRFEGHYFDERLTGATRDRARKLGLANPKVGGVKNPRSQDARYTLLDRACAIDKRAALESTSWGVGQVMGAHWKTLGFATVQALQVEALSGLEGQARLMMRYVRTFGLLEELKDGRWAAFARGYNGPGYRKNSYDTKMAAAAARIGGRVAATDGMLRLGSQGKGVREVQALLVRAGYAVRVDGDYGTSTRDAVRGLQKTLGLTVDGVVGPEMKSAFAAYRVAPDEKLGACRLADVPHLGKIVTTVAGGAGVSLTEAKDKIESAAASAGDLATKLSAIPSLDRVAEMAASGLVVVAGVLAVVGVGYFAWQWWKAGTTYEGVPA